MNNYSKPLTFFVFFIISIAASAQQISYKIVESDPERYQGFIHPTLTMDANFLYLLSLNLGIRSEVFIPNSPITTRSIINIGVIGAGVNTDFKSQKNKRLREIDLGVSVKILGSSTPQKGRMRVVLSNDGEYERFLRGVEGKKMRDIASRASFYHFGAFEMRTTGLTTGISLRNRKHTKIELTNDSDFYYQTYRFRQIYADLILTPSAKSPGLERSEIKKVGYRVGFTNNYGKASVTMEFSMRPGYSYMLPFFSTIVGFGGRW